MRHDKTSQGLAWVCTSLLGLLVLLAGTARSSGLTGPDASDEWDAACVLLAALHVRAELPNTHIGEPGSAQTAKLETRYIPAMQRSCEAGGVRAAVSFPIATETLEGANIRYVEQRRPRSPPDGGRMK